MQGKVSMVMPCYNKVDYIGEMFDSIIAQEWNNIELILVNDGSTDGTRSVISQYEPRFQARGFEVTIIDQENAGVCAAAKAGLEHATGEYVCMVDADDELDPSYVSAMAGWLDDHGEYAFCICDTLQYQYSSKSKAYEPFAPRILSKSEPFHLERYLFSIIRSTVWVYLVRLAYIAKCRIIETYYTTTRGSHEPGYIIPLLAYKGKYKYIQAPLYRFNVIEGSHSLPKYYEGAQKFYNEYDFLCNTAIDRIPETVMSETQKQRMKSVSKISKCIQLYHYVGRFDYEGVNYRKRAMLDLVDTLNVEFYANGGLTYEYVLGKETFCLLYVESIITKGKIDQPIVSGTRVVGYGALGRAAKILLPYLKETELNPVELWDVAGDGVEVKRPDFSSLDENDILLVFPKGKVECELRYELSNVVCRTLYNDDIVRLISNKLFGHLTLQTRMKDIELGSMICNPK